MKSNQLISRRQALITGLTLMGGLRLSGCSKQLPPTYGNLLRMDDTLTYAAHQALLGGGQKLVRENTRQDISSLPALTHSP